MTGSVKVRSVRFMTGLFAFKYGWLVYKACLEVLVLNQGQSEKFFKTRQ